MKFLAIKPFHYWTYNNNTYVYTPKTAIYHNGKRYNTAPRLETKDDIPTDITIINGVNHRLYIVLIPSYEVASILYDVDSSMSSIMVGEEDSFLDEEVSCILVPLTKDS